MVQCTSPFVTAADVDGTVAVLDREGADSAFTATASHGFLWQSASDGARAVNHDATCRPRRQDREPEVLETGAVYAMRAEGFRTAGHRFFGKIAFYEVPGLRSLEIDEPEDLEVARRLAPLVDAEKGLDSLPPRVDAVLLDFDGVLTDNKVATDQNGAESVVCDRSDGLGIERLLDAGVLVAVLSKEQNPVVAARCRKLGVECIQGVDDKGAALDRFLGERSLHAESVVFVGNDLNDVDCLAMAGCGAVVADAHPSALAVADLVLTRDGGDGAVREMADLILIRMDAAR
jgi:YrbI family 3-deoxy-D-manno-octulosonate 8-phosphate phosphatase